MALVQAKSGVCVRNGIFCSGMSPLNVPHPSALSGARKVPQALLFDLDGTLVDTLDDFVVALQAMLADLPAPWRQYHLQRDAVALRVGKGSENLVNQVLALADSSQNAMKTEAFFDQNGALQQRALALYLQHYRHINGRHARVYPGVVQALARAQRARLPMACVTNKPTLYAQELLQRMGLAAFFPVVIGGDAVARKKPDPQPLLEACQRLGVAPQQVWMVGDSVNDAQAARAAHCRVLLVRYGYNHGVPIDTVDADAWCDVLDAGVAAVLAL